MAGVGSYYNTRGVVVGQAIGFYGPAYTPLVVDSPTVFDETAWASTVVTLGAPSAGTWSLTLTGGPLAAPVTISAIVYNVTSTALAALIQAVLPVGLTAVVTGSGSLATPFLIAITGPAGARIVITGTGTLTGGAFALVPPGFTPFGSTEQGWASAFNPSVQDINIEEQMTPVGRNITNATFEFTANLSEDTIENLNVAMPSTKTITAADTTHMGSTQLNMTSVLPTYAVALETANRFKLPRRLYIPEATCAVNVGQTFRRAAGQKMVPVTFSSICPVELIVVRELTAVHT